MANGLAIKVGIGKKPMGGGDFGAPAGFGDTKAPMPPKEEDGMGDGADVPKIPQATADKLINYIMSMTDDGSDEGDQGDDSSAPDISPATPESGQGPGVLMVSVENGEWTPTKAHYVRVEQAVVDLMLKVHALEKSLSGLAFLFVMSWIVYLVAHFSF